LSASAQGGGAVVTGVPESEKQAIERVREFAPAYLARLLHDALRKSDPASFMDDDPLEDRLTIDGHFNLIAVAKMILFDLITEFPREKLR
jgi:hypothetical protein